MEKKPDDWDWVTARAKCSAVVVYEMLLGMATANVATRNAQSEMEQKHERFRLQDSPAVSRGFMVVDTFGPTRRIVAVEVINENGAIRIRHAGRTEDTIYRLSLDDHGDCRLTAGEEHLQPWQVLRRSLEYLFFGPNP